MTTPVALPPIGERCWPSPVSAGRLNCARLGRHYPQHPWEHRQTLWAMRSLHHLQTTNLIRDNIFLNEIKKGNIQTWSFYTALQTSTSLDLVITWIWCSLANTWSKHRPPQRSRHHPAPVWQTSRPSSPAFHKLQNTQRRFNRCRVWLFDFRKKSLINALYIFITFNKKSYKSVCAELFSDTYLIQRQSRRSLLDWNIPFNVTL